MAQSFLTIHLEELGISINNKNELMTNEISHQYLSLKTRIHWMKTNAGRQRHQLPCGILNQSTILIHNGIQAGHVRS